MKDFHFICAGQRFFFHFFKESLAGINFLELSCSRRQPTSMLPKAGTSLCLQRCCAHGGLLTFPEPPLSEHLLLGSHQCCRGLGEGFGVRLYVGWWEDRGLAAAPGRWAMGETLYWGPWAARGEERTAASRGDGWEMKGEWGHGVTSEACFICYF